MDESEQLVEAYLKHCGFKDVRYEPDGNIPPDFLADGRVAVEVRRLNQNHDDGSGRGPRGLEEATIPLWKRISEYLLGLGPAPASGSSWYVFYRYSRPVPAWKTLSKELDAVLRPFMASADPRQFETRLPCGVEVKIFRAPMPKQTFFVPAGHSDQQSGGLLIEEIEANLKLCIAEKEKKILNVRAKYPEWWLVLPDHIGLGLDPFEQQLFRNKVNLIHNFNKIVLIDPRDPTRSFEP